MKARRKETKETAWGEGGVRFLEGRGFGFGGGCSQSQYCPLNSIFLCLCMTLLSHLPKPEVVIIRWSLTV